MEIRILGPLTDVFDDASNTPPWAVTLHMNVQVGPGTMTFLMHYPYDGEVAVAVGCTTSPTTTDQAFVATLLYVLRA